jgi:prepilin-type N-terminal cleavage/methylation domain-containing protein
MFKNPKTPKISGFSLIELLLVVTIIGILAAIAIPSLAKSKSAAQKAAAINNLRVIHSCQTTFYSTNGRYARLTELNAPENCQLGETSGQTLLRSNYVFLMYPNTVPTLASLKSSYAVAGTAYENGVPVFQYSITQDGVINQIINNVPIPIQ